MSAGEVQKARQLEVEHLKRINVLKRVPYSFVKHRTGKEPMKVRWVDTLINSGIHRSRLVAKEFHRGSKVDGFTNFSATPPLELVKLMISMVATAQWDQAAWYGREGHENSSEVVMVHTDISRAYVHAPSKEEKYVDLPPEMGSEGSPDNGRRRVSLYHTRDTAANWEDAHAKVFPKHQFGRGGACP